MKSSVLFCVWSQLIEILLNVQSDQIIPTCHVVSEKFFQILKEESPGKKNTNKIKITRENPQTEIKNGLSLNQFGQIHF